MPSLGFEQTPAVGTSCIHMYSELRKYLFGQGNIKRLSFTLVLLIVIYITDSKYIIIYKYLICNVYLFQPPEEPIISEVRV